MPHSQGPDRVPVHDQVEMGSNRSFGFVFTVVFFIIAIWPLPSGGAVRVWALAAAAAFAAAAAIAPSVLGLPNRIWFRLGLALSRVVTPVVMSIVYVTTVVPIGFVLRASGKDLLRLKIDRQAKSYWLSRTDGKIGPDRFKQQF